MGVIATGFHVSRFLNQQMEELADALSLPFHGGKLKDRKCQSRIKQNTQK